MLVEASRAHLHVARKTLALGFELVRQQLRNVQVRGKIRLLLIAAGRPLADKHHETRRVLAADADFRIRINYTMNEDNTEELKDFWKVFGDIPLNILQLRPVQGIGNSEYQNFSLQKISELLDSVVNPLEEE